MQELIIQFFVQFDADAFLEVAESPSTKWGWYVFLFATAFVKFSLAAVTALAEPSLTMGEFFLTVGGGALISVVFYTYFGEQVRIWIEKRLAKKGKKRKEKDPDNPKGIYRVWNKYGLAGVSALAPIISPMISVSVAVSFKEDHKRIILFNCLSVLIWTIIFALLRDQLIDVAIQLGFTKA